MPLGHDSPATCRAVREALGLTQAEWGTVLDVHVITVSRWERGLATLRPRPQEIFDRLARLTAEEAGRLGREVRQALPARGSLEAFRLLLEGSAE